MFWQFEVGILSTSCRDTYRTLRPPTIQDPKPLDLKPGGCGICSFLIPGVSSVCNLHVLIWLDL